MNTQFDFDEIVPRRGSGSYKWDSAEDDVLPLWVADMDFRTAPAVIDAIRKRVEHGIFGYTYVGKEYYDAVCGWFEREHGYIINPDWIIYTSGVVPAISAIIKAMTRPGDKVIVQTPAFDCFFSSVRNDECVFASNPLLLHDDGTFTIDFDGLERLAADEDAKVLLLCNPHNPSGRCWTRDELLRVNEICLKHNVFVISDEIHCELTFDGHHYTPFGTLGESAAMNSAVCVSPSKAFNIAGLQIANIIAADERIRAAIDRAINVNEVCDVNPFGVVATIAAYNDGKEWLEALKSYIWDNYLYLRQRMAECLPSCRVAKLEATYLAWIDVRQTGLASKEIADRLLREKKVWLNPGTKYGVEGEGFLRINLATPRRLLEEAVSKLIDLLMDLIQS